jgi:geranylgeranyl diphosphate synthase type I
MDAHENAIRQLSQARSLIAPALKSAVSGMDRRNRLVSEYHLGLVDRDGSPSHGDGGKSLRGALALLSTRAAGTAAADGVPAAVAVELIHHYSLLHDDIIDNDEVRRHRSAAWVVYGTPAAILAGDAMAVLATRVLLDRAPSSDSTTGVSVEDRMAAAALLAEATGRLLAGQAADLAFESAEHVPLDDALAMVANKTGALIECAAAIGATFTGAPRGLIDQLTAFGRELGLAFQLVDDLIGLWGHPERSGKPVGSDIASRKKSLPVVAALAAGGSAAARLADIYALPGDLDTATIGAALDAVDEAGGRRWAQAEADRETAAALGILKGIPMDHAVRADLIALTETLCARDH